MIDPHDAMAVNGTTRKANTQSRKIMQSAEAVPPAPSVGVPAVVGIPNDAFPRMMTAAEWFAAAQQQQQMMQQNYIMPPPPPPNTIYVNRLQCDRIKKRRESRRVLDAYFEKFKKVRSDKCESRRKHAERRPRKKNGAYMNQMELEEYYRENPEKRRKTEEHSVATAEEESSPLSDPGQTRQESNE